MHLFHRYYKKIIIWVVLVCLCNSLSPVLSSSKAAGLEQEMRVALFVDIGKFHQQTVPIVTLSSDSGLRIAGETGDFENVGDASYIRFSLDQFHVIAFESVQATEARNASHQLLQSGFRNVIVQLKKNNETRYRVITANEATLQDAVKRQEEIKAKTNLNAVVGGPFRFQAGSFATFVEAKQQLDQIGTQDYAAYITQVKAGNQSKYEVWVGDETTAQAQAELQAKFQQSFPTILPQVTSATEYIIQMQAPIFGQQGESVPFYLISPQSKWTISPKLTSGTPVISVEERSNRSYRGKIELSNYQNKFTVVNILPMEHYLYSVVGTEMAKGWPIEALKVQAIMSRNYAYTNLEANKYGIAHLSDTVFEQAYHGFNNEAPDIRQAVDATQGEFLTYQGKVFSTFYYSNAGGMTADGREVWGNSVETHLVVNSKDTIPETVADTWYRVQTQVGQMGYIHSQYVNKTTQKSKLGYTYGTINTPTLNYRSGPTTDNDNIIGSFKQGDQIIIVEEVKQNNSFSWVSGPFTADELKEAINKRPQQSGQLIHQPIITLKVTERGTSGRVMKMEANGTTILTSSPDGHRSVFMEGTRSLRSTKFEVEEAGSYTVLGSGGRTVSYPQADAKPAELHALSAGNQKAAIVNPNGEHFALQGQAGKLRIASKAPTFLFHGFGFGHGLGASQWGIRGLAEEGYDYRQILQHYFHKDVKLEKK